MPQYALPPIMVEVHFPGFLTSTSADLELTPEFPDLISTGDLVAVARFILNKHPRAMSFRRFMPSGWNKKDYIDKGVVFIGPANIRYRDEILKSTNYNERILRANVKDNGFKAVLITHGMTVPYDPETDQLVFT